MRSALLFRLIEQHNRDADKASVFVLPALLLVMLTFASTRGFLEAVLWIARTDSPWRDLHATFGNWNSIFKRFRRWALNGVFERIFQALSSDPDLEYAHIDDTIIRVHQQGTGARGGLKIRPSAGRGAG